MAKLRVGRKKELIPGKEPGTFLYKGKICPTHPELEGLRYASNCSCYICSGDGNTKWKRISELQDQRIKELEARIQELEEELKNGR